MNFVLKVIGEVNLFLHEEANKFTYLSLLKASRYNTWECAEKSKRKLELNAISPKVQIISIHDAIFLVEKEFVNIPSNRSVLCKASYNDTINVYLIKDQISSKVGTFELKWGIGIIDEMKLIALDILGDVKITMIVIPSNGNGLSILFVQNETSSAVENK